jgi:L-amino acid N-acyltransferase YncA
MLASSGPDGDAGPGPRAMGNATRATPVIRQATEADTPALAAIYNHYIAHTIVTFEETPVAAGEMARRLADVQAGAFPWLVALDGPRLLGYAYATPWRPRSAYRFSAEVTVYLESGATGRGVGSALYGALFPMLEARGIHVVMGGISLPNDASVALHEKFGMRKVAHFAEVGFKFNHWVDVGYWQRTL